MKELKHWLDKFQTLSMLSCVSTGCSWSWQC